MERQTYFAKPGDLERRWHLVDAEGQVLGRMATRLATVLMGKHRPQYTPHTDTGDFIIVVNADKVKMTGRKLDRKFAERYTGYPGGRREVSYRDLQEKHPERLIELAVRRMLPKSDLGRNMLKKLKVYAGPEHPHAAQQPEPMSL